MNGRIIGGGLAGDIGLIAGAADGDGSGMSMADSPPAPEGLGMNTGDGDLLLIVLLCPSRSVRSPLRNV